MKSHTRVPARGWLPQEPYIPSHLKINFRTRQRSKVKATLGLVLLLFGVVALVLSVASVQKTNEIFNDSFSLSPNQTSSPYSVSYNSHSQSPFITQPVLCGEVSIRGENVEFTVVNQEQQSMTLIHDGKEVECKVANQGPQASHQVIQTAVNQEYSFNLPINTPYKFAFQNPSGSESVFIEFALRATWTDTVVLIPGLIVLAATGIPGTTLLAVGLRGNPVTKER
jgi:hypothetical protein